MLFLLWHILRSGIAGFCGWLYVYPFEELPGCLPKCSPNWWTFTPPQIVCEDPTFLIFQYLSSTFARQMEVVLSGFCGLICISLKGCDKWDNLFILIGPLYIFFGEMPVKIVYPFENTGLSFLLMNCKSSLHILGTNSYQTNDLQIFSPILSFDFLEDRFWSTIIKNFGQFSLSIFFPLNPCSFGYI